MAGGTDTHDLAVAAGKQAAATNALATAARDSANIARQQLEASSRPWIVPTVSAAGPLTFTPSGAQLGFEVILSNIGHSPAFKLEVSCEVVAWTNHLNVLNREKRFIESYRLRPRVSVATLFPEPEPQRRRFARPAVGEEVETNAFFHPICPSAQSGESTLLYKEHRNGEVGKPNQPEKMSLIQRTQTTITADE